ncbi:MAG: DNA topoisomerase [Promethearchaeota archaeon]
MSTIIISEKNKAAQAIAEALGPVKIIDKGKYLKIYYVPSRNLYVIPLRGHILEYKNTDAFKSWTGSNPRDIITNPNAIKKFPIKYTSAHISALKEYAKISSHCIIGTDADIEGCNIGLLDGLPFIKRVNPHINVSQMWLSSLQKTEVIDKFNHLIPPKYSWAERGEARAIIDAVIGFSATRKVTITLKSLLLKFGVKFTSIGRVQTSSLYLIYLREQEINNFVPEPYFTIESVLYHDDGTFKAFHASNPFIKELEKNALGIYQKIKNEKIAFIIDQKNKINVKRPPSPLNTSKALILLTKTLKISANIALKTMSSLYLNKLISYPRTDSDIYKNNFDHLKILNKVIPHSQYGKYTSKLFKAKRFNPTRGKKDEGDHPPITPIECVELTASIFENDLQKKVYDLLTRHYLALFGENATESRQDLKLEIKEEPFHSKIVSLVNEGFYEIAPFLKPHYDNEIKITGNKISIKEITFNKKKTKPPPHYSDPSLLKLMEKNHLGTKSTRPQIIKILNTRKLGTKSTRPQIIKILNTRKLTIRTKGKYELTELGTFLIEILIKIWLPFLKPEFTKNVEIKLEEIQDGIRSMDAVVSEVKKEFLDLFDKFIKNENNILKVLENYKVKSYNLKSATTKAIKQTTSSCPSCNSYPMKFINLKQKRFLVCSDDNCKTYLSLPKKGRLTLLKSTCSICNFNIFKVYLRKNNKPFNYYFCPKCWNEGLSERNGKGFCSQCEFYKISDNKCIKR